MDPKVIRKAMMVAKLPPVGPAIQRLQELALAQPVQSMGIEHAMRLVRSAHAYGGIPMPQFGMPAQFATFRPPSFTPFTGGADTFAPASTYPRFQAPQFPTQPSGTASPTAPLGGVSALSEPTGTRRYGREMTAPVTQPMASMTPDAQGTAEGNSSEMDSVGVGVGPVGPTGDPMGPGLAALGYGAATGQAMDPGFAAASLGMLGLGPAGLAVSALGAIANAMGAQTGKGDATDASTQGVSKGGTDFGDPASPADVSSSLSGDDDSGAGEGEGEGEGDGGDGGGDAGGDSGDSGGDSGGGDSGGGDGGGGGEGGEWRGGRQPHAKGGHPKPVSRRRMKVPDIKPTAAVAKALSLTRKHNVPLR